MFISSTSMLRTKELLESRLTCTSLWILSLSILSSGMDSICRRDVPGCLPKLQFRAMWPGLPQYMHSFSLKQHSLSSGESLPHLNDLQPHPQVVPHLRVALISTVGVSSPVSSWIRGVKRPHPRPREEE